MLIKYYFVGVEWQPCKYTLIMTDAKLVDQAL